MAQLDVARARADTPGCQQVAHLNNAGSALPPQPVLEAQLEWLQAEALRGGYELAHDRRRQVEGVYRSVAQLIGADEAEVALFDSATSAWWQGFWSLALRLRPGQRILTAGAEYASNYITYLQARRRLGVEVEVVPDTPSGELSVDALVEMMDDDVGLVSITHVPTNGGLVNPAEQVGEVCRQAGVPFLLDACQSVGQLEVAVARVGCDMLAATGRKFLRGPRGTGFLYARAATTADLEPALLDLAGATWESPQGFRLHEGARRFESWEFNYAALAGLGAACDYAMGWGMPVIEQRVTALAAMLREGLSEVASLTVHDRGTRRSGIVTFSLEGVRASEVRRHLRSQGINVSVSTPDATLLDASRRGLPDLVRASPHYYNTEEELMRLVAAVGELAVGR